MSIAKKASLLSPALRWFLAAPWLGARLWTAFNPRLPFAFTAAAVLLIILPAWIKFRRPASESLTKPALSAFEGD